MGRDARTGNLLGEHLGAPGSHPRVVLWVLWVVRTCSGWTERQIVAHGTGITESLEIMELGQHSTGHFGDFSSKSSVKAEERCRAVHARGFSRAVMGSWQQGGCWGPSAWGRRLEPDLSLPAKFCALRVKAELSALKPRKN